MSCDVIPLRSTLKPVRHSQVISLKISDLMKTQERCPFVKEHLFLTRVFCDWTATQNSQTFKMSNYMTADLMLTGCCLPVANEKPP